MRLIDADEFAERMLKAWDTADEQKRADIVAILANIVTPILAGTPTVDAAPVVRCKDCKYSNDDGTICRYSVGRAVEPEHFCGYGERKVSE